MRCCVVASPLTTSTSPPSSPRSAAAYTRSLHTLVPSAAACSRPCSRSVIAQPFPVFGPIPCTRHCYHSTGHDYHSTGHDYHSVCHFHYRFPLIPILWILIALHLVMACCRWIPSSASPWQRSAHTLGSLRISRSTCRRRPAAWRPTPSRSLTPRWWPT